MSTNDHWAGCHNTFDAARAGIRDAMNVVLEEHKRQKEIGAVLGASDEQMAQRWPELIGRTGGAR